MTTRPFIIKDTHRGLWYEDGVLKQVLEAGRYKLPFLQGDGWGSPWSRSSSSTCASAS